jgi:hypothetical protein
MTPEKTIFIAALFTIAKLCSQFRSTTNSNLKSFSQRVGLKQVSFLYVYITFCRKVFFIYMIETGQDIPVGQKCHQVQIFWYPV